jgi:uncharacterized protein
MPFKKINYKKIIKRLAIAYVAIGIALYFLQTLFLFHPQKISKQTSFNFSNPFTEEFITVNQDSINLVKFKSITDSTKGVVLYFHGNLKNITHYAEFVNVFTKNSYEVWMPDYPSFGKSSGKLSEQKMYDLAVAIKKLALQKFDSSKTIVYGKSLGTGVASYIAQNYTAKQLILETPYNSIPSLFSSYAPIYPCNWLSKYKIPTNQFLKNVHIPITIFHGTDDWVIPYKNARKLLPVLKNSDQFITVEGANHKDINNTSIYLTEMDRLLQ